MKILSLLTVLPFLIAAPAMADEWRAYEWRDDNRDAGKTVVEEEYQSIKPDRQDEKFQERRDGPAVKFDFDDPNKPPAPSNPLYEGGRDY